MSQQVGAYTILQEQDVRIAYLDESSPKSYMGYSLQIYVYRQTVVVQDAIASGLMTTNVDVRCMRMLATMF